ncbi:hypothetical protein [Rhodococcoides fascians]|uniref:hypothetical protein n=1 Tax=Rhodococcoides fascians TaxID=1828 RepID=UPI00056A896E|nr:hypothetical protein [Rhodococcus fascians]
MSAHDWASERRTARHEAVVLENDRVRYARRDAKAWSEIDAMTEKEAERREKMRTTQGKPKLNDGNFGASMPEPPKDGWDWF